MEKSLKQSFVIKGRILFFKKFCLSVKFFFRSLGKSFFIRRLHTKTILILNIRIIFFDELCIILLGFSWFQSLLLKIWHGSKLLPKKRIFQKFRQFLAPNRGFLLLVNSGRIFRKINRETMICRKKGITLFARKRLILAQNREFSR